MRTVGENIKQIRKEKNMTQKELGAKIGGISQQQIGQWETGKANPKIETIEKIAYALDVPITKLVENLTINQYKMTSEYKKVELHVNAYQGIKAILKHMYGGFEEKDIQAEYGESFYYLVGNEQNHFILYEGDIEKLLNYVITSMPFIINEIKDERSENVVIDEILKELNDEEYIQTVKNYINNYENQ